MGGPPPPPLLERVDPAFHPTAPPVLLRVEVRAAPAPPPLPLPRLPLVFALRDQCPDLAPPQGPATARVAVALVSQQPLQPLARAPPPPAGHAHCVQCRLPMFAVTG